MTYITHVFDDEIIIGLAGLRSVTAVDSTYFSKAPSYYLDWSYKGGSERHDYGTRKDARDAMFKKITDAIQKNHERRVGKPTLPPTPTVDWGHPPPDVWAAMQVAQKLRERIITRGSPFLGGARLEVQWHGEEADELQDLLEMLPNQLPPRGGEDD